MDVVPVVSAKDLSRFIRFPHQVYRDDPNWVAPLPSDEKTRLTPGKNPYFEHAEAGYFLARENGRDVGRIAASVDRNHDSVHGERQATFGFLEAESGETVDALIRAAGRWGRERGATVMRGPMNFTTNDDCGLLIRGFEEPPTILMPYNPPSYPAWVESAGMKKAKDLYAFKVPIPASPEKEIAQVTRIALKCSKRHRIHVRPLDMKRFDEELQRVKVIYNSAWDKNWGFVPMTEHEIDHMAGQLKPAIVPDLALFAEIDGEAVGFALALPDVNVALKPLHGRLFPFGIVRLLWSLPRIRTLRLMALGVKAGFRRRGIDAALVHRAAVVSQARGYTSCEVGWTLEDNDLINGLIEAVNGDRYKTYRIYERSL
ncbi:MAG TPA: N-acetyltransferase [Candidatus Dormibacteraeota bacterium]|nr:N-acetyltransferase [Candidatus Dormibacteraeota bacterium]